MSAGQRGSEEEGHSCFGRVRNNWPGVSTPYVSLISLHSICTLYTLQGEVGCPSLYPVPCSDIFLVDDTLHVRLSIHEEKLVFCLQCNGGLLLAFSWHFVSCGLVVLDARELLMCESVHVFSTFFFFFFTYWSGFFSFSFNFHFD